MSAVNTTVPLGVEPAEVVHREKVKLSWGGVFAGLVVTLGVWMLLTVLGLAIGLSAVDPNNPGSLRSAGTLTGIWSAIVPLVALFVGGIVATRAGGILDRSTGAVHGVVLWGIATLASVLLIGSVVRGVVSTAASATSSIAEAAGKTAAQAMPGGGQALGLDASTFLAPANEMLRAEGKPEITPAQMDNIMRDVTATGIREGRLDRETVIRSITANTRLSRADASDVAMRIEDTWSQRRAQLGQRAEDVRRQVETGALKAADTTGHAMWWVFFGMILSLATAVIGSSIGITHRRVARLPEPIPIAPPREVYP